ncbi:MAG: GNAT family N-acetyltransferase [Bacilli bacterium]|nr:GNAT family N-acetyltransferase [Bacilli bacterium]
MKYFKKIEGDRLYLSPINIEDIEIYTKWMNDKEVTENIGVFTKVKSLLSEEEWIKKSSEKYAFAIVLKENDELIGNIALKHVDGINGTATLGVFIGEKENRNKGYGKESIKLLLNYGFNSLNLKNVMLKVYSFNKRAINTYKKIGFKKIGSRRGAYYKDGKRYDIVYMDILKSEFNDIKDFIFTV